MFQRLLIANRGEIACRIIRSAKRLGIETIAVYSDADRNAAHVQLADTAIGIGQAAPSASYLCIEAILDAARASGADAIHPGYGFLSENAHFAAACAQGGIVFVGPPVAAIESMGSKSAAKTIMQSAAIPLLPGYHGDDQTPKTLFTAAEEIGFPVLLKAAAGGGGKGMRIVAEPDSFDAALAAAKREARSAFGDEQMLVEKYLAQPRHVELQIFADQQGNVVHLFDRDCSIQRRHQKIIEEAPAPGLSDEVRNAMAEAAIDAARAIQYVGAGTVEFLLGEDGQFFFMEMNTRLQVEHPVTEMITGIDLVEWQLRVANGQPLPCPQADIQCSGHAIECRIYAEDPDNDFLPMSGTVHALLEPAQTPYLRIDSGLRAGDHIGVYYDPMIAKLITHADTRNASIQRMKHALRSTLMVGPRNNLDFLHRILSAEIFRQAIPNTGFIADNPMALNATQPATEDCVAGALLLWQSTDSDGCDIASIWQRRDGWRANQPNQVLIDLVTQDGKYERTVTLLFAGGSITPSHVICDHSTVALQYRRGASTLRLTLNGQQTEHHYLRYQDTVVVAGDNGHFTMTQASTNTGQQADVAGNGAVRAPMPGRVVRVLVKDGDTVAAGGNLLVLEAMKMEHALRAPVAGIVTGCRLGTETQVDGDELLLTIVPSDGAQ